MNSKNTIGLVFIGIASLALTLAPATASEPKDIWQKTCTKCHGPDGKGSTKIGKVLGIKDFTDAQYQGTLKDEAMLKAIKEGIKDGEKIKMKPAEGLNDDEMKSLVTYVRAFRK
jgi:cytochrome c553